MLTVSRSAAMARVIRQPRPPVIRVRLVIESARLHAEVADLVREDERFAVVALEPVAGDPDEHGSPDFAAELPHAAVSSDVIVTDSPAVLTGSTARSREAPVAVVLLSDDLEAVAPMRAHRGGIALLATCSTAEQIVAAIEAAAAGLVVLHADHAGGVTGPSGDDPLTPREREVLQMLAAGLGNKEIAARLGISDHTAKFHVSQILAKLGAASRAEAVSIGMRRGLVPL